MLIHLTRLHLPVLEMFYIYFYKSTIKTKKARIGSTITSTVIDSGQHFRGDEKNGSTSYTMFFTHLAFVRAIVSFLNVFYLQGPIIRSFRVQYGKPLVVCIREQARRQDMPVPAAHPRYLKPYSNKTNSSDQKMVRIILSS